MPQRELKLVDGRRVAIDIPEPGEVPSYFLIGLPKAGSTLLNRVMRPISAKLGASFFSIPNELYGLGLSTNEIASGLNELFEPHGYAYLGFRGLDAAYRLPAFASGRTVLLVRDPRDMMTSMYFSEAFSHVAPGAAEGEKLLEEFQRNRAAALAEPVDDYALRRAADVRRTFERTQAKLKGVDHKLYRYEDVVFAKLEWVADMLAYLGLPYRPALVERIVAANDVKPETEDPSAHIRRVAPGDHKSKLAPSTIAKLDDIFAPILSTYGY